MDKYVIYIVSDSIGETAEYVARATAAQFDREYEIVKFPFVREKSQIAEVLDEAKVHKSIVLYTTVIEEFKDFLKTSCISNNIPCIDVMSTAMHSFQNFLDLEPKHEPGIIRRLDEKYFKKVEAIEFAVKYDDGKDPRGIKKADVVLLGVSRTSKTPLSMYLANKNLKVANVPLVPEVPVPKELYQIPKDRIIGLTTNPIKLNEIRQERLKALGLSDTATYANLDRILEELDYADKIMKKIDCPIIDVATKAVEETANIIIDIMRDNQSE
ncbi:MAG: kinase/pyrophosphorylase [Clostridiales bacterium]|nr:kinase/pyrophosphorylase [Clostridiales bacterium]